MRYLNAVGGGRVVRVSGNMAWVDDDGFETPVLTRECVVVGSASHTFGPTADHRANSASTDTLHPAPIVTAARQSPAKATDEDLESDIDTSEVAGGDSLNITLGYEAIDISHIGDSGYEAFLINDSNYYLYFTYATRADASEAWSAQYAGIIEPNIQLLIGELNRADVAALDNIAIQIIAFKRGKEYALKQPVNIQRRLDTTKFFKVHCFKDNDYFERRVLAIDLVKNDTPVAGRSITPAQADMIADRMVTPKVADRPVKRPVNKSRATNPDQPLVVDLHINQLLDTTAGMSNGDILNYQIDHFRRVMDSNLRHHGQKIIFIHGKGDGVLRQALLKELNHRYKGVDVCDASFREYGYGATLVTIRRLDK